MLLTLLRHATAELQGTTESDFSRVLINKGFSQTERVANYCKRNKLDADLLLSSPYPRAKQTAKHLKKHWSACPEPELADWLKLGSGSQAILAGLSSRVHLSADISVILVLHEPDISELLATLLNTDADNFDIKKASLTQIQLVSDNRAILNWTIPCSQMY